MKLFFFFYFFGFGILVSFLVPQKSKAQSITNGSLIYNDFCYRCHGVNGVGRDNLIPPLKSSDYLLNNINLSIAGLKYGLKGEIIVNGKVYDGYMAYQGLDNEEIADVMNYILNQWGNNYEGFIDASQVENIPKSIFEK